jgi:hypothetical protein
MLLREVWWTLWILGSSMDFPRPGKIRLAREQETYLASSNVYSLSEILPFLLLLDVQVREFMR